MKLVKLKDNVYLNPKYVTRVVYNKLDDEVYVYTIGDEKNYFLSDYSFNKTVDMIQGR